MKQLVVFIGITIGVLFTLVSCGESTYREQLVPGPAGQSIQGNSGSNGKDGSNGLTSLLSLSRFTSDTAICASGAGSIVHSGLDSNSDNVLEASEIQQSTVICDGTQGQQGVQGNTGAAGAQGNTGATGATGAAGTPAPQYAILKFITPCPSITTGYREVIIKLVNGQFLSSFSASGDALTVRLALIPNGSYVDTDGSNCNFNVSGTVLTDQFGNVF